MTCAWHDMLERCYNVLDHLWNERFLDVCTMAALACASKRDQALVGKRHANALARIMWTIERADAAAVDSRCRVTDPPTHRSWLVRIACGHVDIYRHYDAFRCMQTTLYFQPLRVFNVAAAFGLTDLFQQLMLHGTGVPLFASGDTDNADEVYHSPFDALGSVAAMHGQLAFIRMLVAEYGLPIRRLIHAYLDASIEYGHSSLLDWALSFTVLPDARRQLLRTACDAAVLSYKPDLLARCLKQGGRPSISPSCDHANSYPMDGGDDSARGAAHLACRRLLHGLADPLPPPIPDDAYWDVFYAISNRHVGCLLFLLETRVGAPNRYREAVAHLVRLDRHLVLAAVYDKVRDGSLCGITVDELTDLVAGRVSWERSKDMVPVECIRYMKEAHDVSL